MAAVIAKVERFFRGRRRLPYWHGTCTLDHWSPESVAKCERWW